MIAIKRYCYEQIVPALCFEKFAPVCGAIIHIGCMYDCMIGGSKLNQNWYSQHSYIVQS